MNYHRADDASLTSEDESDPPLKERSFQQLADVPIKATYKGSSQGQPSRIPFRSSTPSQAAPGAFPDERQGRKRPHNRMTEDSAASSVLRRYGWVRYPVIAAIILCSLYAVYTGWIIPKATALSDQWHYGDARVSHTTMVIGGRVRDLLGIGYNGQVEVIILPDPKKPQSTAQIYLDPQSFPDTGSRAVLLHPMAVNPNDQTQDIVVEVEGTTGVSQVLYGRADGSFQWNSPS